MFGYSKALCPPSGVDFCVYANFTGGTDRNVILAKHNLLEVYVLEDEGPRPLRLVSQQTLYGTIGSLAIAKFVHGRDCLLVTFLDAKVCAPSLNEKAK